MKILTVLLAVLLLAAVWDFRKGKVPNILIAAGAVWGIVRLFWLKGAADIFFYLPGAAAPILLFFPLYKVGTLGAGDIKLFSLLGFYFTFLETIYCIAVSFLLAAIFAAILMLRRGNFAGRMTYLFSYLRDILSTGRIRYYYGSLWEESKTDSDMELSKMNFAVPIFLGVLLYVKGGLL